MKKIFTYILFVFLSSNSVFSQFVEVNSGVSTMLSSVSVVDVNYFWACGPGGVIIKSTNGGTVWTTASSGPISPSYDINHIYGVSSTNAFILCMNGTSAYVYRTTTGGAAWTASLVQSGGYFNAMCLKPPLGGFLCGNPVGGNWSLYSTNSSGGDWQVISPTIPAPAGVRGCGNAMFNSSVKNWFVSSNATIYYSTNDGANFTVQNLPAGARTDTSGSIWFNYTYSGMAGANTNLYKTTNSGSVWTQVSIPGNEIIRGVTGVSTKWWVIRGNKIYYSGNDGGAWTLTYIAPGSGYYTALTSSRLTSGNTAVTAVRSDGGISLLTTTTESGETGTCVPSGLKLYQNYPNPFNPTTSISFDLNVGADVSLKVYDMTGKEADLIYSGYSEAGSRTIQYNAGKLSSGIYYCILKSGAKSEIIKMIVLK